MQEAMIIPSAKPIREVRSFARRKGRLTATQRLALIDHWSEYGIALTEIPLDFNLIFQREAPTFIDIGFGRGEALTALAAQHPEWNFIGIEVYEAGVGQCLQRLVQQKITNVRLINEDAVKVLKQGCMPHTVQGILLWFPDPWPKKRHAKRRLVQLPFAELIAKCLVSGGYWHIATDWLPYRLHIEQVLSQCKYFAAISTTQEGMDYKSRRLTTKYARRGERLGHEIWDGVYQVIE